MEVALFSYRKGNSFFHKLSPHIKLWLELLFCVFVFLSDEWFICDCERFAINEIPIIKFAIALAICVAAFFLSGKKLASLKPLGYVVILGILAAFGNGIKFAIIYTLKFLFAAFMSQAVFMTTSSLQMKSALEEGQNAIAKIFPLLKKANVALLVFLAISFIPQIFQTWGKIKLAAKARSGVSQKRLCGNRNFLQNWLVQFEALFSCLLYQAETKRKALLNRGGIILQ